MLGTRRRRPGVGTRRRTCCKVLPSKLELRPTKAGVVKMVRVSPVSDTPFYDIVWAGLREKPVASVQGIRYISSLGFGRTRRKSRQGRDISPVALLG